MKESDHRLSPVLLCHKVLRACSYILLNFVLAPIFEINIDYAVVVSVAGETGLAEDKATGAGERSEHLPCWLCCVL